MLGLFSLALVQPAAAIDVEIRYRGVVVIYRLSEGEVIEDSWTWTPASGRRGRSRLAEVRVGIEALETDGGLQVAVLIEEPADDEPKVIASPTLLLRDDSPRAWFSAGSQVPLVRTHTGSQDAAVYLATRPVIEVLVFPEGEHGDEVIEAT